MAATLKLADNTNNGSKTIKPLNITIKQVQRNSSDVSAWRSALQSFDSITNPNRVKFYDLIDDITLDGQIEATWSKRVDAIANVPLIFMKDGKEDEDINKILNFQDFWMKILGDFYFQWTF